MKPSRDISRLIEIMAQLRSPDGGCPWDLKQSFSTIAPYTVEEAYEVADAIERHDFDGLKDELGDLLLQVVFHARMAEEENRFAFGDVVQAITEKLIRRHPHVFGDAHAMAPEDVKKLWEDIKATERAAAGKGASKSALDGVSATFPALIRAEKVQKRAAQVGFDWSDPRDVAAKVAEELEEINTAQDQDARSEEIGDLLFAVVNLARHSGVDGESALRRATAKFERRFRATEALAAEAGRKLSDLSADELDGLWRRVKAVEKSYEA